MTKSVIDNVEPKKKVWTKWVYKNKKDGRGIVVRNKARLVAQGYTQEEEIDYDEVFALVARIEAIRLFLAYASFKDFVVYQINVKSAFLYGKIEKEVYVCQPLGYEDPKFPDRVYKVEKALYGLHQAPRAWKEMCTEFEKMMHKKFQMMHKKFQMMQVTQKDDGIFISQDKYVDEILKKFSFSTVKTASTPMETSKPLMKDENAEDVDVYLYRSMIRSLMYLTSSKPDIMFVVCACTRFQVTPKVSHLHVMKRIFRYLKGQPKLGLWYPKDSPFNLEAYTDSDYAGASLDRNFSTRGVNFLGSRLISWHVLWIQNQMLDYGYNFMNTKIFIDNKSTICIVKNPVFHSKTKHIEIQNHFIKDSCEKRLIQVIKIYTYHNVSDLLIMAFDALKFADSHNMVAYLEKSTENADFDEIVDFLNANPIGYALTVSPTIYVSYIKQFWSTTKTKTVNNETQIRARVDGKTIIITESSVRRDLHFDDEDAVFNDEYDTPSHTKKVFANMRRKGKDFLGTVTPLFPSMLALQTVEGEGSGQPIEPQHTPTTASPSHIEPIPTVASSSHPKKTHKYRKTKRKATKIYQSSRPTTFVAYETVHEEREDIMERASTTASSLEAEQDSGNILRTQSLATLNELIPKGNTILGDRHAQTRFERLSKQSNDPPLSRVNTLGSGEDSMKLNELMEICTKLSERVLAFENIKTAQDLEITNLKKRVKKLEKKKKSRTPQLKRRLFKFQEDAKTHQRYGHDIEINTASTSITTASINITTAQPVTTASAPITTAGVSVSTVEPITPPTTTTIVIEDEDLTIAQTLIKMRSVKSKEKSKEKGVSSETATRLTRGVIMKEASETATRSIVPPQQQFDPKDKGKGIMQEPEKPVKVKGKDQIKYDADVAQRLQAELDEEVRLEREREEEASNAALLKNGIPLKQEYMLMLN
ncbi:putative ribonuclease H-like domain-containing protein [Tanacetum coccineum]